MFWAFTLCLCELSHWLRKTAYFIPNDIWSKWYVARFQYLCYPTITNNLSDKKFKHIWGHGSKNNIKAGAHLPTFCWYTFLLWLLCPSFVDTPDEFLYMYFPVFCLSTSITTYLTVSKMYSIYYTLGNTMNNQNHSVVNYFPLKKPPLMFTKVAGDLLS